MVKLEEVEDEAFAGVQAGTDEDDWNTDDGTLPRPLTRYVVLTIILLKRRLRLIISNL